MMVEHRTHYSSEAGALLHKWAATFARGDVLEFEVLVVCLLISEDHNAL